MSLHLCCSLLVFLTQLRFVERVKGVTCSRGFTSASTFHPCMCPSVPQPAPGLAGRWPGSRRLTSLVPESSLPLQSSRAPGTVSADRAPDCLQSLQLPGLSLPSALRRTPALARMGPEAGAKCSGRGGSGPPRGPASPVCSPRPERRVALQEH